MKDYKRIVCALETFIKEIRDEDIDGAQWITATFDNELHDGSYVDDEEFSEWLLMQENGL